MDREHHAVTECVHHPAVIILLAESGVKKILLLVSSRTRRIRKSGTGLSRSPSQAIFPYGLISQTTASEILVSDNLTFLSLHRIDEEPAGKLRHQQKALATLTLRDLLRTLFRLDDLHIVFLRKITQGLDVCHALMLHHESDSRAGLAATETLVYAL